MKREELEALGITDKAVQDKIMATNGNDINAAKASVEAKDQQIAALKTELEGFKQQVVDRDKDIADLRKNAGDNEALNKKLTDLQAKYDSDTASLNKKLDEQARDHATEKLFADYKFTSAYAKKAAIAEFRSGNPEFKDGKFTGAADIIKKMQDEEKKLASTQRI